MGHGIPEPGHVAAAEETGNADNAGMSFNAVPFLEFDVALKLTEAGLEIDRIEDRRQVKQTSSQRVAAAVIFDRGIIGVARGVSGIIHRSRVYDAPVQGVVAGIMCIFVVVKDIDDAELVDRELDPVVLAAACKLVEVASDVFVLPAKPDRLSEENPVDAPVGMSLASLVSFSRRKIRRIKAIAQAKALIDLGVCRQFASCPRTIARVEDYVSGFTYLSVPIQAVLTPIGCAECKVSLAHNRELGMEGEPLLDGRHGRREGRRGVSSVARYFRQRMAAPPWSCPP